MSSVPDKPERLSFLDGEPWPKEPRDIRKMKALGNTTILDHNIEPVDVESVGIDISVLEQKLNQSRLETIALELVALTFGEMVEFAESIINAKGDNDLPDRLTLATILHMSAENRLNGSSNTVRSNESVLAITNKPKNGRGKAKDDNRQDPQSSSDTLPVAGK